MQQDRRRQVCLLTRLDDALRVALRHLGFRIPIRIVRLDEPRIALFLDHAVARQRIGDRPAQYQVGQARLRARPLAERQRRVARIIGL